MAMTRVDCTLSHWDLLQRRIWCTKSVGPESYNLDQFVLEKYYWFVHSDSYYEHTFYFKNADDALAFILVWS